MDHQFTHHFENKAYTHIPGISVLDAKSVDPTTVFIGSHISVVKPLMMRDQVPQNGGYLIQDCFRCHNLALMKQEPRPVQHGGYFRCHGLIAPYCKLIELVNDTINFVTTSLGDISKLRVQVAEDDVDLIQALNKTLIKPAQIIKFENTNGMRHRYGDDQLSGRDIHLHLQHGSQIIDFGIIAAIDKCNQPKFVEVALVPGKIVQSRLELSHFFDIFSPPKLAISEQSLRRIIEDAFISIGFLYSQGLRTGKSGQPGALKRCLNGFLVLTQRAGIQQEQAFNILFLYCQQHFSMDDAGINAIKTDFGKLKTVQRSSSSNTAPAVSIA